jgi:hypothetical protein
VGDSLVAVFFVSYTAFITAWVVMATWRLVRLYGHLRNPDLDDPGPERTFSSRNLSSLAKYHVLVLVVALPPILLEGGPRRRNTPSPPEDILAEAARDNFLGRVDEVPVFELLHTPKGRIWILDLAAFATWRQWLVNEEGAYLRIEFEGYDTEQALDLARKNPDVLRSEERETEASRAAAMRSRVYLRVRERFEVRVKDQNVARGLNVPDELRL